LPRQVLFYVIGRTTHARLAVGRSRSICLAVARKAASSKGQVPPKYRQHIDHARCANALFPRSNSIFSIVSATGNPALEQVRSLTRSCELGAIEGITDINNHPPQPGRITLSILDQSQVSIVSIANIIRRSRRKSAYPDWLFSDKNIRAVKTRGPRPVCFLWSLSAIFTFSCARRRVESCARQE